MEYTEIILCVPTEDTDTAAAIVGMAEIGGIYIEDYSDMMECELVKQTNLVDEELLARDREHSLLHVYLAPHQNPAEYTAFWEERLAAAGIPWSIRRGTVREEDYANCWKKYFKPLPMGKLTVVPSWVEYTPGQAETPLYIDPGMAFGTGSHETTASCLQALQERLLPGMRVLDAGCGSGILSIGALLLGAERVLAIDIDPNAARIAGENAALNRFDGTLHTLPGNLLRPDGAVTDALKQDGPFDVVLANIVADVIIPLTGQVRRWMTPHGLLITAGIIAPRRAEVLAALEKNGFAVLEEKVKNDWICFVCGQK